MTETEPILIQGNVDRIISKLNRAHNLNMTAEQLGIVVNEIMRDESLEPRQRGETIITELKKRHSA